MTFMNQAEKFFFSETMENPSVKVQIKRALAWAARDFYVNRVCISILDVWVVSAMLIGFTIYNVFIGKIFAITFAVLLFHEAGHLYFMKRFKYSNLRLHFFGLFAFVQGSKEVELKREQLLIFLGGPLPGIVLGILLYIFNAMAPNYWIESISRLLIIINFLNLLPLLPLDGGNYIRLLLYEDRQFPKIIHHFLSFSGFLFFYLLTGDPIVFLVVLFSVVSLIVSWVELRKQKRKGRITFKPERKRSVQNDLSNAQTALFVGLIPVLISVGILFYNLMF